MPPVGLTAPSSVWPPSEHLPQILMEVSCQFLTCLLASSL